MNDFILKSAGKSKGGHALKKGTITNNMTGEPVEHLVTVAYHKRDAAAKVYAAYYNVYVTINGEKHFAGRLTTHGVGSYRIQCADAQGQMNGHPYYDDGTLAYYVEMLAHNQIGNHRYFQNQEA
jgi:hypothetical protein